MNKTILKKLILMLCVFALIFTSACGNNSGKTDNQSGNSQTQEQEKKENQSEQEGTDSGNIGESGDNQGDGKANDQQGAEDGKTDGLEDSSNTDENKDSGNNGNSESGSTGNKSKDNQDGKTDSKTEGDSKTSDKDDDKSGIDDILDENDKVEVAFTYNGKNYGFRKNIKTYLIMGIDRYGEVQKTDGYICTGQCDALYLLIMDHDNDEYTILQLNRDAIVDVDVLGVYGDVVGTEKTWLCIAHAYGDGEHLSCKNVVNTVSRWLNGITIDGYAALQFDALKVLNDDIGGVEVYIEDDFSEIDTTLEQGTTVRLWGDHALNYVHIRREVSDGLNPSRMRRQRTYLTAFKDQFYSKFKSNPDIVDTLYNDAKSYMCTSLSLGSITNIIGKAQEYKSNGFVTIDGNSVIKKYQDGNNYMNFYADEASLNETVIKLFCKEVK